MLTSTGSVLTSTPLETPDALLAGQTASWLAMADILAPQAVTGVQGIKAFVQMVKQSSPAQMDEVFRNANKAEKANGKTLAPLIYILAARMGEDSAAGRVSEGRKLWTAIKRGYSPDVEVSLGKNVTAARKHLKLYKAKQDALTASAAVAMKFATMLDAIPAEQRDKADAKALMNTAKIDVAAEVKASEYARNFNKATAAAIKVQQWLVPVTKNPAELVPVLVALYGEQLVRELAGHAIPTYIKQLDAERKAKADEAKAQAESNKAQADNEKRAHVQEIAPVPAEKPTLQDAVKGMGDALKAMGAEIEKQQKPETVAPNGAAVTA